MKRSHKILTTLTLLVIVIMSIALVACNNPSIIKLESVELPEVKDGQFTIVIQDGTETYEYYVLDTDKADSLFDALKYLNENQELNFKYEDSQYGTYITEVGNIRNQGNSYIMFFTSVTKDHDTSAYATTYDCGGVKVTTSGQSAEKMRIENKCVIYICLVEYSA